VWPAWAAWKSAALARPALLALALVAIGCTRGGPHPEPPRMHPTGPGGVANDAGQPPGTPDGAGGAAGLGAPGGANGGASGAGGAGQEPTRGDCPDAGAADAGSALGTSPPCDSADEDAGALR
jgi:hypothetical protein